MLDQEGKKGDNGGRIYSSFHLYETTLWDRFKPEKGNY